MAEKLIIYRAQRADRAKLNKKEKPTKWMDNCKAGMLEILFNPPGTHWFIHNLYRQKYKDIF